MITNFSSKILYFEAYLEIWAAEHNSYGTFFLATRILVEVSSIKIIGQIRNAHTQNERLVIYILRGPRGRVGGRGRTLGSGRYLTGHVWKAVDQLSAEGGWTIT
jgi:hypothetical protein